VWVPGANQNVVFGVLKLTEVLLPAGTVTDPAGADVYGLAGIPLSHQVTGGADGAAADPGPGPGSAAVGVGAELEEVGAVGTVALGLPAVEEVDGALAAVDGAGSRATVTATGSDEGVRLHVPASAVPCCPERVAAAT
jgi:hypothetical protein